MFGALRWNEATKDHEHIKLSSDDSVDARGYTLVACDQCRIRKLKCNGDRNGCSRCLAATPSTVCVYSTKLTARAAKKRPRLILHPDKPLLDSSPGTHRAEDPKQSAGRTHDNDTAYINCSGLQTSPSYSESSSASSTSLSAGTANAPLREDTIPPLDCQQITWDTTFGVFLRHSDFDQDLLGSPCRNLDADIDPSFMDMGDSPGLVFPPSSPFTPTSTDWDSPMVPIAAPAERTVTTMNSITADYHSQTRSQATPAGNNISCACLGALAQLLEHMDVGGGGGVSSDDDAAGRRRRRTEDLDTLLMCLARGTRTCSEVLACTHCNACADNSMLVATIAQQLGSAARKASSRLLLPTWRHHQEQQQLRLLSEQQNQNQSHERITSTRTCSSSSSSSTHSSQESTRVNRTFKLMMTTDSGRRQRTARRVISDNNHGSSTTTVDDDDDDDDDDSGYSSLPAVSVGRYRIEAPETRLRLISDLVLLHIADFEALLNSLRERVGAGRGAYKLLAEEEYRVAKVGWMIQQVMKK
ncbi:hypothetical protein B0H66DRAFT_640848 [Apodospora peruviana]|uniref:Zn(2)-C6 fungal-type domain-containing protein n=1 Tax=Apodospora peruviana TaxID=516989 RepID=A0AAE0HZS3_9PEZI|nr:hypothetical protein B0H66DRAFT_640848 [Apodospora peruviana]